MSYDYANLKDETALPLIQRYGTPITVHRKGDTSMIEKKYNPATKSFYWVNTATGEEYAEEPDEVNFTFNGFAVLTRYTDNQVDGSLVKRGDIRLLAINIPHPQLGDLFKIGDSFYQYVYCEPIAPGNIAVVYKIQIRI